MQDGVAALEAALVAGGDLRPLFDPVLEFARRLDAGGKTALLGRLDALLRAHDPSRLGPVALLAGAIVEVGADPRALPPAIFDRLGEMLATIQLHAGDEPEFDPPEAFHQFVQAAAAALSRSVEMRRDLPQKASLQGRVVRYRERYGFLNKMLSVLDDEPIVVVHAPTGRAWRARIRGIADNFQLHLLLLATFAGAGDDRIEGTAPTPQAIAASTDGDPSAGGNVASDWQLAQWFALRPGGLLDVKDYLRTWIWNEGFPAEVAPFEGIRVVLIGPTTLRRSFGAQRVFAGMPGRLERQGRLADAEARDLMSRMLTTPPP